MQSLVIVSIIAIGYSFYRHCGFAVVLRFFRLAMHRTYEWEIGRCDSCS